MRKDEKKTIKGKEKKAKLVGKEDERKDFDENENSQNRTTKKKQKIAINEIKKRKDTT